MKLTPWLFLFALSFLLTLQSLGAGSDVFKTGAFNQSKSAGFKGLGFSDDRDLSGAVKFRNLTVDTNLKPDHIQKIGNHNAVKLHFLRQVKTNWTPVSGLPVIQANTALKRSFFRGRALGNITDQDGVIEFASCTVGSQVQLQIALETKFLKIVSQRKVYSMALSIPCGTEAAIQMKEDSLPGQALGIWQVAQKAGYTLSTVSDLQFWKKQITFNFPDSGDYYNFNTVHLTLGHQWDVVAHEMGHAIYDQANIGSFGGGEHKIDQCYSAALGLSEGWASFFAAWTQIPLNDPDAKFEYMVPRRAPIRVENVPADVCTKSESEWRVISYLWDLVDLHNDGEDSAVPAKKLWDDLLNAQVRSVKDIHQLLLKKGWNPAQLKTIWNLNFPGEPLF